MSPFFAYLYRLRWINRWNLMRNGISDNVAEHSFHVALLTHALCTIGVQVFGKQVPVEKAVTLALFHDATEVITGDIPSPIKHHNEAILQGFREIESLAAERLCEMVPPVLADQYRPLILNTDPELACWVKAADLLDAYLKCTVEIVSGNREYIGAQQEIAQRIEALEMEEVDYFMEHFAPSFARTLDELSRTEI